jgi:hypothetical protein
VSKVKRSLRIDEFSSRLTHNDRRFSQESGSKPTHETKSNDESVCKSTCSIILTTDMCPAAMIKQGKDKDGCTTHTYTFSPDQVCDFSSHFFHSFRCRFSDKNRSRLHETPVKPFSVKRRLLPDERRRGKPIGESKVD